LFHYYFAHEHSQQRDAAIAVLTSVVCLMAGRSRDSVHRRWLSTT